MKQRILCYHMAPVIQAIGHRSSLSKPVLNVALSSPTWAIKCFIGCFGFALTWAPSSPTHSHFLHYPHSCPASCCHTLGSLTDYPLIPHYLPHPTQSLGPHHNQTFPPTPAPGGWTGPWWVIGSWGRASRGRDCGGGWYLCLRAHDPLLNSIHATIKQWYAPGLESFIAKSHFHKKFAGGDVTRD